jgi:hypothetical protein
VTHLRAYGEGATDRAGWLEHPRDHLWVFVREA